MTALDDLIAAVEAGKFWHGMPRPSELHTDICWKAFHGSLDAAKALHDALLPGWEWSINGNGQACTVWPPNKIANYFPEGIDGVSEDKPARAWLLAVLKAYKSQGGST